MNKEEIIKKNLGNSYEYHDVRDWDNLIENAMDEYAKQKAIGFLEYENRFRKEENLWFRKECEKLGGIFSLADYGVENIYNDFVKRKPIRCHWDLDGRQSQWEYDENGKLVHKIIIANLQS